MQLRRAIAAGVVLALTAAAPARTTSAQPVAAVDARGGLYIDSDHTQIITATAAASGTIKERVTITGRYLADIVTSASVDVVSAATKSFSETRHEADAAVAYADGTRTANVAYVFSTEEDWTSHSVQAGASHDFYDHQLTIGLGGSVTFNAVGRSEDANFARELTQGSAALSTTIVATKADLINLTYTFMVLSGYQASPYRFVHYTDPSVPALLVGHPETDPEGRIRHALGARWNRHVFSDSAIRAMGRVYADDWGVVSGTLGAEYIIGFGPVDVGLLARGYIQRGADFYAPTYAERRRYMTADRELSPFVDVFGGARVSYKGSFDSFVKELRAEAKAEGFLFHYFDYPLLVNRTGLLAELGFGASF